MLTSNEDWGAVWYTFNHHICKLLGIINLHTRLSGWQLNTHTASALEAWPECQWWFAQATRLPQEQSRQYQIAELPD